MTKPEEGWRHKALCSHQETDFWYGWEDYVWHTNEAMMFAVCAIKICNNCPVKKLCLKEGLKNDNIEYGIWGGLLPIERLALKNIIPEKYHSPNLAKKVRRKLNDMVA